MGSQHTDSPPSQVEKSEAATSGGPQQRAGSHALNNYHAPIAEPDCYSVQKGEARQGTWHVNLGDQYQLAAISSVVSLLTDTKTPVQSSKPAREHATDLSACSRNSASGGTAHLPCRSHRSTKGSISSAEVTSNRAQTSGRIIEEHPGYRHRPSDIRQRH